MRRWIFHAAAIIVCFLLQCSVFDRFRIASVSPNLLIVLTASVGFMRGKREGLIVGFFSGLLLDIMAGSLLGFYALIYMLAGYLNGLFQRSYYPENIRLPILSIGLSDFSVNLIIYLFMFFMRRRFSFGYYLIHTILPELAYTAITAVFLYLILLIINNRLTELEQRSAA